MAQNKDQLDKLLKFIKRLVDEPGNEEFTDKLCKMLNMSSTPSLPLDNSKVSHIEKYLGLDYRLDSASPIIDYSFINDEYVRERLNSDNREMLRYRFGLRGHKEDFKEVCRYAVLQEELLLNYYFTNCFTSYEHIQSFLCQQIESVYNKKIEKKGSVDNKLLNEKERELNKIKDYSAYEYVPLSTKQKAFANKYGEEKVLEYARRVRNELSHRNTELEEDNIISEKQYLEGLGVRISNSGYIDSSQFNNNAVLSTRVLSDKRYWDFIYKVWKGKKPSDDVISALQQFTEKIKGLFNNYGKV